jgi:hypothetical protein
VLRLQAEGISATQATVTRDLQELGTIKVRDEHGSRRIVIAMAPDFTRRPGPPAPNDGRVGGVGRQLRQPGGRAHARRAARTSWRRRWTAACSTACSGSVAGDDTILVIASEERAADVARRPSSGPSRDSTSR